MKSVRQMAPQPKESVVDLERKKQQDIAAKEAARQEAKRIAQAEAEARATAKREAAAAKRSGGKAVVDSTSRTAQRVARMERERQEEEADEARRAAAAVRSVLPPTSLLEKYNRLSIKNMCNTTWVDFQDYEIAKMRAAGMTEEQWLADPAQWNRLKFFIETRNKRDSEGRSREDEDSYVIRSWCTA
jgi:hypothetical protein